MRECRQLTLAEAAELEAQGRLISGPHLTEAECLAVCSESGTGTSGTGTSGTGTTGTGTTGTGTTGTGTGTSETTKWYCLELPPAGTGTGSGTGTDQPCDTLVCHEATIPKTMVLVADPDAIAETYGHPASDFEMVEFTFLETDEIPGYPGSYFPSTPGVCKWASRAFGDPDVGGLFWFLLYWNPSSPTPRLEMSQYPYAVSSCFWDSSSPWDGDANIALYDDTVTYLCTYDSPDSNPIGIVYPDSHLEGTTLLACNANRALWYCLYSPFTQQQGCYIYTADQLYLVLSAGNTLVSGPHVRQQDCLTACGESGTGTGSGTGSGTGTSGTGGTGTGTGTGTGSGVRDCFQLTPTEVVQYLIDGYGWVSGPHDTLVECQASCDSGTGTGTGSCYPVSIPTLYNTGFDDDGVIFSGGSCNHDNHYDAESVDDGVAGIWMANDSTSRWVAEACDGVGVTDPTDWETTFTLPGDVNPDSLVIRGRWSCDDAGLDILVNGVSSGNTFTTGVSGGDHWEDFTLTSGFTSGANTLTFRVDNAGGTWHGVRVEFLETEVCAGGL